MPPTPLLYSKTGVYRRIHYLISLLYLEYGHSIDLIIEIPVFHPLISIFLYKDKKPSKMFMKHFIRLTRRSLIQLCGIIRVKDSSKTIREKVYLQLGKVQLFLA